MLEFIVEGTCTNEGQKKSTFNFSCFISLVNS